MVSTAMLPPGLQTWGDCDSDLQTLVERTNDRLYRLVIDGDLFESVAYQIGNGPWGWSGETTTIYLSVIVFRRAGKNGRREVPRG